MLKAEIKKKYQRKKLESTHHLRYETRTKKYYFKKYLEKLNSTVNWI